MIERVSHTFAPGKSTTTIEAGGGWEQLERWRAPQAWQVAAGAMTRDAIFQRVASRAGLEWLSGTGDEAPSSDWTTYKPAFAVAQGESGKAVLLRLLAVVPDYVRANGGTLTVLGIPDVSTGPRVVVRLLAGRARGRRCPAGELHHHRRSRPARQLGTRARPRSLRRFRRLRRPLSERPRLPAGPQP